MRYQHIVFDVDGTLVDTEKATLKAFRDTVREVSGREEPIESLGYCFGITTPESFRRAGLPDEPRTWRIWDECCDRYAGTDRLFDGIEELLGRLKGAGCTLGIVTSRGRQEYNEDILQFGLERWMSHVICADDSATHKPEPGPLLAYLERAGAGAGETLYIGDSIYDSKCAAGAEVDFALAVWGSHVKDRPAKYYPETPEELWRMLQ